MPERGEVLDRDLGGALLGEPDVASAAGEAAPGEHAGRAARDHACGQRAALARARHDQAVDARLRDEPLVGLLRRLVPGVLGQQHASSSSDARRTTARSIWLQNGLRSDGTSMPMAPADGVLRLRAIAFGW